MQGADGVERDGNGKLMFPLDDKAQDDRQSTGDRWLVEPPKIQEFADGAIKISKSFAALEKALHELQQDIRRQDGLSHDAVRLYRHRYQIERDAAAGLQAMVDAQRDSVIEECAKVCEEWGDALMEAKAHPVLQSAAVGMAAEKIRALMQTAAARTLVTSEATVESTQMGEGEGS